MREPGDPSNDDANGPDRRVLFLKLHPKATRRGRVLPGYVRVVRRRRDRGRHVPCGLGDERRGGQGARPAVRVRRGPWEDALPVRLPEQLEAAERLGVAAAARDRIHHRGSTRNGPGPTLAILVSAERMAADGQMRPTSGRGWLLRAVTVPVFVVSPQVPAFALLSPTRHPVHRAPTFARKSFQVRLRLLLPAA